MSDFLTRVAERALGTAPRIDPQSASRYAPARLPLPESPLPDNNTSAADDTAMLTPPRDSYDRPGTRQVSHPLMVTPVTEDTVANDPDFITALKPEHSPEEPGFEATPIESQSRSITHRTAQAKSGDQRTPLESQTRSMTERDRDTAHTDRALVPEQPSIDASRVTAFEPATIRDDAGHRGAESSLFENHETNRRTSAGYVSAPKETTSSRGENDPQTAGLVSTPSMNDRDVESKMSIAADSIRSSTAPPAIVVQDDRQPAMASDHHHETRGAISADFVRPATARVDHSSYERAEQSEPSIRVTIGRVEVRTAPPPAVVEPVALPAPKLSLAEFLRQHNERRR